MAPSDDADSLKSMSSTMVTRSASPVGEVKI